MALPISPMAIGLIVVGLLFVHGLGFSLIVHLARSNDKKGVASQPVSPEGKDDIKGA